MIGIVRSATGRDDLVDAVEATRLATALLGDSIATNLFMLGFAYQLGLIPISAEALDRAIELNGVATERNRQAFLWGRPAAHDTASCARAGEPPADVLPAGHGHRRTPVENIKSP